MGRLRWLDQALGHNGLLTVMAVRLTHVVPFGLSNVALGLSRVSAAAVFVGTLVGNVPAVAAYVGVGAGSAGRWPFAAAVAGLNAALLVPLAGAGGGPVAAGAAGGRPGSGRPGRTVTGPGVVGAAGVRL